MPGTARLWLAFLDALVLIRQLQDHELGLLQPLFEIVFKHGVSLELLRWKYAGQRGEPWVVAGADGLATVHCGLYFRIVMFQGVQLRVAQLVDLMALPKAQGLSRTDSPFAVLMRAILASLPRADNPAGIAFGFPSERAMRLGERMKVYRSVDRVMELEFAPVRCRSGARHRVLSGVGAADVGRLNKLWQKMSRSLSDFAVGVRDAQYVQQRYLAHPERAYTLLLIESRWLKTPIGLAVVGPGDERRELLDVVCDLKDAPEVIGAAQGWLMETAGKALSFLLTERFARQLAPHAVRCEPTQFRIMGNPFSPAACLAALEGRWWLTGGDTDYR
jgi:hypothetical protein